jgi:purine-binding chemotaxis protein CheW
MNISQTPSPPSAGAQRSRDILKARARELARPFATNNTDLELEIVEFRLAHERYAVEQRYVKAVHSLKELTPLPCTPSFVSGLINVRGQILPVLDIKRFFELPESGITDLHRVIVVHFGDVELGLLADAISGVGAIPLNLLQPSLPTLTGIRAQYLKGITPEQVVILDVPKILSDPKVIVNEEVET